MTWAWVALLAVIVALTTWWEPYSRPFRVGEWLFAAWLVWGVAVLGVFIVGSLPA